jgi:hypothetical protein
MGSANCAHHVADDHQLLVVLLAEDGERAAEHALNSFITTVLTP